MAEHIPTLREAAAVAVISAAAVIAGLWVITRTGGYWFLLGWAAAVLGVGGIGSAVVIAVESRRQ